MPLTDYQRNWLIQKQGFNPDEYTLDSDEENIIPKPTKDQPSLSSTPYEAKLSAAPGFTEQNSGNQNTALETFGKSAAESAIPSIMGGMGAGLATAEANPLAHMLPPYSELAFGVGGALAGGYAGRKIQNAILPQSIQDNVAQAQQEHPIAGLIGSLAATPLGGLNPSPGNLGSAARGLMNIMPGGMGATAEEAGNLLNVGIGAGIGAGQPLAEYAMSPKGTPFPTQEMLGGALGGALFNKPNAIGKMMGFHSNEEPVEFTKDMLEKQSKARPSAMPQAEEPILPQPEAVPKLEMMPQQGEITSKQEATPQQEITPEQQAQIDKLAYAKANLKSQPYGKYPTELPKEDYISKVEATQPTDEDLFEQGKKPVYSKESNLPDETPPISHKEYQEVWDKWEEHAGFIGQSLFPDKSPQEQINAGKNAIEAIQKRDPLGKRIIDVLISRGKLDINKSQQFEDTVRGLANTLRESNYGKGKRYSEEGSVLTPQQELTRKNLDLEGLSGNLTPSWFKFAQKLGVLRNVKLEEDGTIKNVDTDEPVAGQTVARQGLNEVIAKVNPALAGADTPVHEEMHSFINDMEQSPRGRDSTIVKKYYDLIEKSPDYLNWKAARDAKGLASTKEEFASTNAGMEAVNRAISNDGPWQKWWKDFSAYAKTRFGEHGTLEDFQRVMHYKLLHDPAFSKVFGGGELGGALGANGSISNQDTSNLAGQSDYDRYQEIQKQIGENIKSKNFDNVQSLWKESEEIKNRNKGMPPEKNSEKSNLVNPRDDSVVSLIHNAVVKSDVGQLSPEDARETSAALKKQVKWNKDSQVLKALKDKNFDPEDVEHWKAIQNFYNAEQFQYESPEEQAKAQRRERLKEEAKQVPAEKPLPTPKKVKAPVEVKEEIPAPVKEEKGATTPVEASQIDAEHAAVQNEMAKLRKTGTKYTPELIERFKNVRRQINARDEANAPSVAEQLKKSLEARQVGANAEETPTQPLETKVARKAPIAESVAKVQGIESEAPKPAPEYNYERDRKEFTSAKDARAREKAAKSSWDNVDRVANEKDAQKLADNLKTRYMDLQEEFHNTRDKDEGDYIRAQQIRIRAQLDFLERHHSIDTEADKLPKYQASSALAYEPNLNWRLSEHRGELEEHKLPYGSFGPTRTLLDSIIKEKGEAGQAFSDAYHKWATAKDSMFGQYMVPILKAAKGLSKGDLNKVENIRIMDRRLNRDSSDEMLTAKQKSLYDAIQHSMDAFQQDRIDANHPVSTQNPNGAWIKSIGEIDPFYHPNAVSPDVVRILTEEPHSRAAANLQDDFIQHQSELGIPQERAQAMLDSMIAAYSKKESNNARFREVRIADRTQLPDSWMRNGLMKNLNSFFNRVSADRSFHDNFETNPEVAAALGLQDPWGGEASGDNRNELQGSENVSHAMDTIYGTPFDKDESWVKTANRIATALFLGPLTNMHIAASSLANSIKDMHPGEVIPALGKAIINVQDGYKKALEQGYARKNFTTFHDVLDSSTSAYEKAQSVGSLIAKINGRDATNAFTKGLLQNIGDWVVKSKLISAEAGDKAAIDVIKHIDPDWESGKQYTSNDIDKLASTYAGMVHGIHDPRTLPGWMLRDTAIQPFFQLASWNIAQTNAWMRHVYTPLKNGNPMPFLMSTLGAVGGGWLINQLRESISDKKSAIPSFTEIANSDRGVEGNIPLMAYKAMALSSYVGYMGILSTTAKAAGDVAFKNIPQSATFPLDEVFSGLVHRPLQAIGAMINDPNVTSMDDYVGIVSKLATDIVKENIQFGRIATSWIARNPDVMPTENYYKELNKKTSQLRRFKMVEGLPYEAQTATTGNPYMDLPLKAFKHTDSIGEAAGEIPGLLGNALQTANGNPDVLQSLLHKIKANTYETLPDMEKNPYMFSKYLSFLKDTVGSDETHDILIDYLRHKAINQAKSEMVPSL